MSGLASTVSAFVPIGFVDPETFEVRQMVGPWVSPSALLPKLMLQFNVAASLEQTMKRGASNLASSDIQSGSYEC